MIKDLVVGARDAAGRLMMNQVLDRCSSVNG